MSANNNELIEMIYETSLDPALWPLALDGVSEILKQYEFSSNNGLSHIEGDHNWKGLLYGSRNSLPPQTNNSDVATFVDDVRDLKQHEVFNIIKPHLHRAIKIRLNQQKVDIQCEMLSSLLDKTPLGILIVDKTGKILLENSLASTILDEEKILRRKNSLIQVVSGNGNDTLKKKIMEISLRRSETDIDAMQISVNDEQNASILFSHFTSNSTPLFSTSDMVMLFVTPPLQHRDLSPVILKQLYGLTHSEIKLANALTQGKSLKKISADINVTVNTLRTHLSSLFLKTNTSRQSELICHLLTSPAAVVADQKSIESYKLDKHRLDITFENENKIVILDDGRKLGYSEYGPANGRVLVYCHCVYGCRLELPYRSDYLIENGIRLLIPDRPGIGLSDPHQHDCYSGWSQDLEQLVDQLGVDRFTIVGKNLGGNYALGAAWALGKRIKNVIIVSPSPPVTSLEQTKQYTSGHRFLFVLAQTMPTVAVSLYNFILKGAYTNPSRFFSEFVAIDNEEQKIACEHHMTQKFNRCIPELVKHGTKGTPNELYKFVRSWRFELSEIGQSVSFYRGKNDKHVPQGDVLKLVESIPNATLHQVENHGHTIFYTHWETIYKHCIDATHVD